MKQIFKTVLGTVLIILFLGIVYTILNSLQAEEEPKYDLTQLTPKPVPLYCGDTSFVFQTAFELFGEVPIAGAEVRSAGDLNNPIIGILTFTYNKEWNKGTLMMTVPSQFETCILGYGVNWEFFPPLKEILEEGNESR
tara:strand:+ start:85 stop:498 length:414 start_codon:yes stop_codon:yes gene_type:complete